VQVGHDLGIEIVAEGIERPEQLELLRAMGCGLGQGYLVARPMTAPGIESLADADARRLERVLLSASEDEPEPPGDAPVGLAAPNPSAPSPSAPSPSAPSAAGSSAAGSGAAGSGAAASSTAAADSAAPAARG
jgi:hypothetical protein